MDHAKFLKDLQNKVLFYYALNKQLYSKYNLNEHTKMFAYLLCQPLPVKQNLDLLVEAHYSSGLGDIMNANKTCHILRQLGYNVKLITFDEESDAEISDEFGRKFNPTQYYNKHSPYDKVPVIHWKQLRENRNERIVFRVALPEAESPLKGDHLLFIDEYNGHRFKYSRENIVLLSIAGGIGITTNRFPCSGLLFTDRASGKMDRVSSHNYYFVYNSDPTGGYSLASLVRHIFMIAKILPGENIVFVITGTLMETILKLPWELIGAKFIYQREATKDLEYYLTFLREENATLIEVIWINAIAPTIFLNYMYHSQEPLLISGDQSFTEAIEMNKLFCYQLHEWKQDLYISFLRFIHIVLSYKYKEPAVSPYETFQRLCVGTHMGEGIKPRLVYRHILRDAETLAKLFANQKEQIQQDRKIVYHCLRQLYDFKPALNSVIKYITFSDSRIKLEKFMAKLFNTKDVSSLVSEYKTLLRL